MFQQVTVIISGLGTSEATQAISVLWLYMDSDLSSVVSWLFYNDITKCSARISRFVTVVSSRYVTTTLRVTIHNVLPAYGYHGYYWYHDYRISAIVLLSLPLHKIARRSRFHNRL
jgi:hypothetical protein